MKIRSLIGKGSPGMRCLVASRARNFMPNSAETALFQGMVQNPIPYKGKVFTKGSLYGVPVATTPMRLYGESRNAGDASATAGTRQPGRDHWPRAF